MSVAHVRRKIFPRPRATSQHCTQKCFLSGHPTDGFGNIYVRKTFLFYILTGKLISCIFLLGRVPWNLSQKCEAKHLSWLLLSSGAHRWLRLDFRVSSFSSFAKACACSRVDRLATYGNLHILKTHIHKVSFIKYSTVLRRPFYPL